MALPRTDPLDGAAGPLDATYTQQRTTGTIDYNGSGAAVASVTDADLFAFDNTNTYPNEQYSKTQIGSVTGGGDAFVHAVTRASGTGDSSYNNYFAITDGDPGAGHTELWETITGTATFLRSFPTGFVNGDWIELRSIGNVHEVFKAGVSLGSHTDSSLPTGDAGLGLYNSAGGGGAPLISAWEGGRLDEGAPIRTRKLSTQQRMVA